MSALLSKLLKAGSTSGASVLSESDLFSTKPLAVTTLPILNLAFHGHLQGGVPPGVTILAGESKTFKSALSLYCMKAYLDEFEDAVGILYDSEFGITPEYIRTFGIDPARVLHIPIEHVEQLKFDFTKKLEELKRGDHVFFMIDSIGQLSSKKEVEDAHDEKSVADMSRAKSIRSLMRLITIQLSKKNLPCFMINHVYATMELYSKIVIPGGCLEAGTKVKMFDGSLKNIEDIELDDLVMTLEGAKPVEYVWNPDTLAEGTPECFKITFSDGNTVVCSEKHPFLTTVGWVAAQDLNETHDLVCVG